jgi:hypothetical protein
MKLLQRTFFVAETLHLRTRSGLNVQVHQSVKCFPAMLLRKYICVTVYSLVSLRSLTHATHRIPIHVLSFLGAGVITEGVVLQGVFIDYCFISTVQRYH